MSLRTAFFIFLLVVAVVLLGFNYFFQPFANFFQLPEANTTVVEQPTIDPVQVELDRKSVQQKIATMLLLPITISSESTEQFQVKIGWANSNQLAGVTLFGDQISSDQVVAALSELDEDLLIAVDHEGGQVQRLAGDGFDQLPSWQEWCQEFQDVNQSADLYEFSAAQLAQVGVDIVFAPVLDLADTNRVLGSRVCSSNPDVVLEAAQAYIDAFMDQGVLPVVKHFPGIGQTTVDLHDQFQSVQVSSESAQVYQQVLEGNPSIGVMVSHVGVEQQFPEVPCSLSQACVLQIANQSDQALIVTDALDMVSASFQSAGEPLNLIERSARAVAAGNHLLVFGPDVGLAELSQVITGLSTRYQQDELFAQRVDQANRFLLERW